MPPLDLRVPGPDLQSTLPRTQGRSQPRTQRRPRLVRTAQYSIEVLAEALVGTKYRMGLQPLFQAPMQLRAAIGAIANLPDERHWVALRYVDDNVWKLNSTTKPVAVSWQAYLAFVAASPGCFPITVGDLGDAAPLPNLPTAHGSVADLPRPRRARASAADEAPPRKRRRFCATYQVRLWAGLGN